MDNLPTITTGAVKRSGGLFNGRVLIRIWTGDEYIVNRYSCKIDRLSREDALEDAEWLAADIAAESGGQLKEIQK